MRYNELDRPDTLERRPESSVSSGPRAGGRPLIATRLNIFLTCVVLGGTMFQLFGLPFVVRAFGMRAALLLLPIMLLQPLHWGLIHEAIHFHLFPGRRANDFWARVLSVTLGLPFDGTRFGHMVHHRFSRHGRDRPDVYDGRGPYPLAWLSFRARLFGGVYMVLLVTPLIAFMPTSLARRFMEKVIPIYDANDAEVQRLFVSLVMNATKRRRTRREFAMTLALYGASAWLYGPWWPMLLATMYVRGVWHSFADNAAHHGVPLDKPERAQNFALPQLIQPFVMNHHLHLTHHLHPTVPWTSLAGIEVPHDGRPNDNYFRAVLRQTNRFYPRPRA